MDEYWREEAGRITEQGDAARMADAAGLDCCGLEDGTTTAAPAPQEQVTRVSDFENSRGQIYPALLILPLLGFGVIVFLLVRAVMP